jgi:TM2 domain-containing membrane protein YozV
MRFMPPPQTVAPPPSIPAPPPVVEERSPLPSYLQKSTKLAFFLAFLPGLFCIMGLGHFYAKKVIKGVILLVIGFFPGLLAWVSLFMVFTETKYEISVYIIMTMFLWAIFAALLLWSAFDASKQVRKFNALPPEKLLRSKDGLSDGGFRKSRF